MNLCFDKIGVSIILTARVISQVSPTKTNRKHKFTDKHKHKFKHKQDKKQKIGGERHSLLPEWSLISWVNDPVWGKWQCIFFYTSTILCRGDLNIYVITSTSFNGSGGKIREIPFSVWIHWMCRCESGKGKTAEINGCERVGNAHGPTYSSHCCSGTKFNAENVKVHLKCRHNFLICSPASPQPLSTLYFPRPQKAPENSPGICMV